MWFSPYDIERFGRFDIRTFTTESAIVGEKAKERKLSSIRSLYKYLYKKELIATNVALKVDMPKLHDKPIVRLEADEVGKLIDTVSCGDMLTERERAYNSVTRERDLAIIYVFLGTGIRVSELVGLNKNDVDFNNQSFAVTRKGGNRSIIYMPIETAEALHAYLKWLNDQIEQNTDFAKKINDPDALFYSLQGTRIGVRTVEKLIKKYASPARAAEKNNAA